MQYVKSLSNRRSIKQVESEGLEGVSEAWCPQARLVRVWA
jgi:hypothetical protein